MFVSQCFAPFEQQKLIKMKLDHPGLYTDAIGFENLPEESKMKIETGDRKPIYEKPRQHFCKKHTLFIMNQLDVLLQAGAIKECKSPWNFNFVIADKKGPPYLRLCLNFIRLNLITTMEVFQMQSLYT